MRIRISKRNSELIDRLTHLYGFKYDGIIARIAFSLSLQLNRTFEIGQELQLASDGKDWRDERGLFGVSSDDRSYNVIYKALLDQHYDQILTEEAFVKLFKRHLDFGLERMDNELSNINLTGGQHIVYLMKLVKNGLDLVEDINPFVHVTEKHKDIKSWNKVVTLCLGSDENDQDLLFRINDLQEFDSCNIAIAGMVGSGKTELVKDLLYQISIQSDNQLKFIFFDYKGEGNPERLESFFKVTNSKMVDVKKAPMDLNPLGFINLLDKRAQEFNIKSFVDFICTIATQLGSRQKHILQTVITESFNVISLKGKEEILKRHPTISDIFENLKVYYNENEISPDTLYSIISDLSTNIFNPSFTNSNEKIYETSTYINLPIELSDTLRQLCVFLTLKYLLAEFSSTNDTEPTQDRIKPLRYVIVIDEAHVYLKNKNASKALEDILRILRSKGVVVVMLTQGVEDYKTKNFDFASQVKIPICLNINNKDYKLIESFVGTPRSKQKLQQAIYELEPQKGLINLIEPKIVRIRQFWQTINEG